MPNKPVPWLKLWPELVDHEKFAQLNDSECWTWVKALAKSGQQPTRGRYQSVQHAVIVTGRPRKHFDRLMQVRLMDQREDGLWMHDWEKWQRWRPEDVMADYPSPPDRPPNGLSINTGSTHEPHTNGENKTGLRDKSIENRNKEKTSSSPAEASEPSPGDDRVDELYGHYKARIQPKSRLCPRKKIAARLKRFSVDELRTGIDHFADDPWWMEHNSDKGAEWFFESDARAEQFLLMQPRAATNVVPINGRPPAPTPRLPIDRTGVAN